MTVFIGWDARDALAAEVCASSIRRRTARQVRFLRLSDPDVARVYRRAFRVEGQQRIDLGYEAEPTPFSTDFSFSRFLVPWLMGYQGWALFTDPDTLWTVSPEPLFEMGEAAPDKAVLVVPHVQTSRVQVKMGGLTQRGYPKKNWSSVCLWNCAHPKNKQLVPEVVNRFAGKWLHGFGWLEAEDIGTVGPQWNWLVGEMNGKPKIDPPHVIHYTLGGPWLFEYKDAPWADLWHQEASDYWWSGRNGETKAA